jgi:photosystem II stability/assembly factor-like uncharacterized protein
VYAATQDNGVFKATDGGASWKPVNVGLPGGRFVVVMVMDPQEESSLYVALDCCGTIFKTTNGGMSWKPSNSGLPLAGRSYFDILALAIDPQTIADSRS